MSTTIQNNPQVDVPTTQTTPPKPEDNNQPTQSEARPPAQAQTGFETGRPQQPAAATATLDNVAAQLKNKVGSGSILKRGSSGVEVKEMQQLLNRAGANPPLELDGKFGPKTDAALRQFQNTTNIKVDGKFGPESLGSMKRTLETGTVPGAAPTAPTTPSGNGDLKHVPGPAQKDTIYNEHDRDMKKADLNLTGSQKADMEKFKANYEQNKHRYEAVSQKTGVPPELIAALHWRESSGNFKTYLHQGDPLGKPATHVPRNIPVFHRWESAAVHALNMKKSNRNKYGLSAESKDVAAMLSYAERYNGLGYHNRGRISPYVYSGTDVYTGGKYVADGKYDPNHKDRQLGVLPMLMSIM